MTRSVLMLTTAGKTFATARTVGSAAGSAWAEAVLGFAETRRKAITARQIVRAIPMSAVQLTKRAEHCQLARIATAGARVPGVYCCVGHRRDNTCPSVLIIAS